MTVIVAFVVASALLTAPAAWGAEPDWSRIEQVVLAEAANQGEEGLYAVACVFRNRGYDLSGFSAARRPDLLAFGLRQPRAVQLAAARALDRVRDGGVDVTGGATHYENVAAFGVPWWAEGKEPVAKIKDHTFWRLES